MLSVASLSAFSGAIGPAQPLPVRLPSGGGTAPAPSASPTPPAPQIPSSNQGTQAPTYLLPRGSLLDLSV